MENKAEPIITCEVAIHCRKEHFHTVEFILQEKATSVFVATDPNESDIWRYLVSDKGTNEYPLVKIMNVLSGKITELNKYGISNEDIIIWIYKAYDQQCNIEFSPAEINDLSILNVPLCITCWQV